MSLPSARELAAMQEPRQVYQPPAHERPLRVRRHDPRERAETKSAVRGEIESPARGGNDWPTSGTPRRHGPSICPRSQESADVCIAISPPKEPLSAATVVPDGLDSYPHQGNVLCRPVCQAVARIEGEGPLGQWRTAWPRSPGWCCTKESNT